MLVIIYLTIYLTPFIPLSFEGEGEIRKEGLMPLLDAPLIGRNGLLNLKERAPRNSGGSRSIWTGITRQAKARLDNPPGSDYQDNNG